MEIKNWVHTQTEEVIPENLHADPYIAKLLFQRKIQTPQEMDDFFNPKIEQLHDPFLLKDMDIAVERLHKAIESKEKILVYGDYDVDGTTSVAVVYSFLDKIRYGNRHLPTPITEKTLLYFIPNRHVDGYGLSLRGIDYAYDRGVTLMIILDCGITAHNQVIYAKEKGIDVIVCDHHRPVDDLPDAIAVLNPLRSDCTYPFKDLSGCGVGFKLIEAYARRFDLNAREYVYPLMDLVAISIASDLVSAVGENRLLLYFGLMLINTQPRPGIEAILSYSKMHRNHVPTALARGCKKPLYFSKELTTNDLVFFVGPRINSAGRMESGSGRTSVDLLLAKTKDQAKEIGKSINEFNIERKSLDSKATQDAILQIETSHEHKNMFTNIVFDEDWDQGIIGIVASRLIETYYRPTIVFTTSINKDLLIGSARSIKGFDIHNAIGACNPNLLEHFGGHKYAAGLAIKPENLQTFKNEFDKIVGETINKEQATPEIVIDAEIDFSIITNEFLQELNKFAPFGPENLSPIFMSTKVKDAGSSRVVGSKHLKLSLYQPRTTSFPLNGIGFQFGHLYSLVKDSESFDICYHLEENDWNGRKTIQLNIKDLK